MSGFTSSGDPEPVYKGTMYLDREIELMAGFGVDFCVSVSSPLPVLVPREEWVPDSANETCTFCSSPFSFFHRRHHCRRCGRVICSECSHTDVQTEKQYIGRLCRLCYAILKQEKNIQLYFCYVPFLTGRDPTLRLEVVRGLRNCLQTEPTRLMMVKNRRDVVQLLIDLLDERQLPKLTPDELSIYGAESAEALRTQIVATLVNISATLNDQVIQALVDANIVSAVRSLCETSSDYDRNEVLQELALWAVRNVSRLLEGAAEIKKAEMIELLAENVAGTVKSIQEYSLAILANLAFHCPELVSEILNTEDLLVDTIAVLSNADGMRLANAARLLAMIARAGDDEALTVYQHDAVPRLIHLLGTSANMVVLNVIRALASLVKHPIVCEGVINQNAVAIVLAILDQGQSSRLQSHALTFLKYVARQPSGLEALNAYDGFAALMARLLAEPEPIHKAAKRVIQSFLKMEGGQELVQAIAAFQEESQHQE